MWTRRAAAATTIAGLKEEFGVKVKILGV